MQEKPKEKSNISEDGLEAKKKQAEKRYLVSTFFVALLIGLAYQEMVAPVREAVRASGITFSTFALVAIFFFVSVRFFIGNQLHLLSDGLAKLPGLVWLYDLMIIIIQCVVLVFMGGDSTVAQNQNAVIDFVDLLITLYVIDVLWIISQWVLGKILPSWKRGFLPWVWGVLNAVLVIFILILRSIVGDVYSTTGLMWLFGLNFIAFVVDVVLVDYYDAI